MKVAHVGGFKLKSDTPQEVIEKLTEKIKDFQKEIPGILVAYAGPFAHFDLPNSTRTAYKGASNAVDLNRGYTHGFYLLFENEKSREDFETSPIHLSFGPIFTPYLEDNMNSVIVFDYLLPD